MLTILRFLFFVLFSLYVAVFAAANREEVVVELVPEFYSLILPLSVVIIASTMIGFLLGTSYHSGSNRKLRKECSEKNKQIKKLKEASASLRNDNAKSLVIK